jgi:hypothetical protein
MEDRLAVHVSVHPFCKIDSLPIDVLRRLFTDWLQLFLLVVNPAYGFNIQSNNK